MKVESVTGTLEVRTSEGLVTLDLTEHALVLRDESNVLKEHRRLFYVRNRVYEAVTGLISSIDNLTRG